MISIGTRVIYLLKVVGVVGFMDGRLDIPQELDPRVSAIILECWQRCFPLLSFDIVNYVAQTLKKCCYIRMESSNNTTFARPDTHLSRYFLKVQAT